MPLGLVSLVANFVSSPDYTPILMIGAVAAAVATFLFGICAIKLTSAPAKGLHFIFAVIQCILFLHITTRVFGVMALK
jgi:hypothetical protein